MERRDQNHPPINLFQMSAGKYWGLSGSWVFPGTSQLKKSSAITMPCHASFEKKVSVHQFVNNTSISSSYSNAARQQQATSLPRPDAAPYKTFD
jgi:hypothetical protein